MNYYIINGVLEGLFVLRLKRHGIFLAGNQLFRYPWPICVYTSDRHIGREQWKVVGEFGSRQPGSQYIILHPALHSMATTLNQSVQWIERGRGREKEQWVKRESREGVANREREEQFQLKRLKTSKFQINQSTIKNQHQD